MRLLLADAGRDAGLDARRIRAAYVLAIRDNVDVIPVLARMLEDPSPHVPCMARNILSFAAESPNCRATMMALIQKQDRLGTRYHTVEYACRHVERMKSGSTGR